jgi:hypothetical protein
MSKLLHVAIDEVVKPVDGEVLTNRYWCVHPVKGLAFWDRGGVGSFDLDRLSPQCNSSKVVSDHLVKMHPDHLVQKVSAVYIGNLPSAAKKY